MPKATLGNIGNTYERPPDSIRNANAELADYLMMIHQRLFGLSGSGGDLAPDNVNSAAMNIHAVGAPSHNNMIQAQATNDVPAHVPNRGLEITSANPTNEASQDTLLVELKGDFNDLLADYDNKMIALTTAVNNLLSSLRSANVIAS